MHLLQNRDSNIYHEIQSSILEMRDNDTVVSTKERVVTIIDSLLQVEPKVNRYKTYKIKNGKIISIIQDSTLNLEEYMTSLKEKMSPFLFFCSEKYPQINSEHEAIKNIKKILSRLFTNYH